MGERLTTFYIPYYNVRNIIISKESPMASATVTSKGQITIPAKVRNALGLDPGDRVEFVEIGKREFSIVPATGSVRELKGIFKGRRTRPVSLEEMDRAIAKGSARSK
jgi:antitoxin PrlF